MHVTSRGWRGLRIRSWSSFGFSRPLQCCAKRWIHQRKSVFIFFYFFIFMNLQANPKMFLIGSIVKNNALRHYANITASSRKNMHHSSVKISLLRFAESCRSMETWVSSIIPPPIHGWMPLPDTAMRLGTLGASLARSFGSGCWWDGPIFLCAYRHLSTSLSGWAFLKLETTLGKEPRASPKLKKTSTRITRKRTISQKRPTTSRKSAPKYCQG